MKYVLVYHYWEISEDKKIRRHNSLWTFAHLFQAENARKIFKANNCYSSRLGDRLTIRRINDEIH